MNDGAALIQADALHIPLADASVDLIITSPPYFALRSYRDGDEHYDGQIGSEATPQAFLEALWAVTAELWRVLKPSGSLWVNLGDKYAGSGGHNNGGISKPDAKRKAWDGEDILRATRRNAPDRYVQATEFARPKSLLGLPWRYAIGCIDGLAAPDGQRWILRAEVVWSKPNGLPESVTDRVRRSHEQWFHMTKQPRYFAAVDEVREPSDDSNSSRKRAIESWDGSPGTHDTKAYEPRPDERQMRGVAGVGSTFMNDPLGKLPGSVWTIPSEPLIIPPAIQRHYDLPDHFAAFPQEWPRRIILGWSPSGICRACGEGRRPVVASTVIGKRQNRIATVRDASRGDALGSATLDLIREATITGYACACPDASAPTTPARVLDCFTGTGTTVMVARALGRFGVGLDLSADYLRLARWRITSGAAAKAVARTHRENQGDLFASLKPTHQRPVATESVGDSL